MAGKLSALAALLHALLLLPAAPAAGGPRPYEGVSALAAMSPRFPCKRLIHAAGAAERPAVQVLYGTFGTGTGCLKRFADRFAGRDHLIEFHLLNGSCLRFRRCLAGEPFPGRSAGGVNRALGRGDQGALARVRRRVAAVARAARAVANPRTRLVLSTGLETEYTKAAHKAVLRAVRAGWPHEVADNQLRGAGRYRTLVEAHAPEVAAGCRNTLHSFDGFEVKDPADAARHVAAARAAGCEALFLWFRDLQGLTPRPGFVPPRRREFRFADPEVEMVRRALG